MHKEGVDVSITGNSTNPTRFQHPVAGTYKKESIRSTARSTSQLLQAVVQDVHFTRITWQPVLLLTV